MKNVNFTKNKDIIFDFKNNMYIMGILNVTPNSFFDGGRYMSLDNALRHSEEMIKEGADIIDVGGISTKPGFDIYKIISIQEEIDRVIPVVENIHKRFNVSISLDTFRSKVAEEGLKNGVNMINDQFGLTYDNNMANTIAKNKCYCVLMHNYDCSNYTNIIDGIKNDLSEKLLIAKKNDIENDKIILDPGIGPGKSLEQNLKIIKNSDKLNDLNCPILLGCSRKGCIRNILNTDANGALYGTLATTAVSFNNKVSIIRVHDVKANVDFIKMLKAIHDVK